MEAAKRCKFWLPRKSRFCANSPSHDSQFCNNHNPMLEQLRIPCPIDPSHSVLKENLEDHVKKCPLLKQTQTLEQQPYYKKGINGGSYEEKKEEEHRISENPDKCACMDKSLTGSSDITTSDMKRNAVYTMSLEKFIGLVKKIKSVHGSICSDIQDSYKIPEACNLWMNKSVEGKLPFQEKHVLQQASILGNLEELEVLENPTKGASCDQAVEQLHCKVSSKGDSGVPAVIEFGAGRGYLTQLLADCYGIRKVYLVERRSYRLKADRSLRQKESLTLERLRIDIEDLDLSAVQSLKGMTYLAIGKHLCGPATDLSLRCCIPKQHNQATNVCADNDCCLRGLAIATCCHHLCQWNNYINKNYFSKMGITKDDFHAITWFTSWAVEADYSSDLSDMVNQGLNIRSIKSKECGVDVGDVEEIMKNMPAVERAVLGFMCKEIIDMGRLMWLKEHGLQAQLVKYVPSNISPENHLLVARHGNHL